MKLPSGLACFCWSSLAAVCLAAAHAGDAHHASVALRTQGVAQRSVTRTRSEGVALRLCNAYPFAKAMDVLLLNKTASVERISHSLQDIAENLVTDAGLPYKACADLPNVLLEPGSELDFRIAETYHVGSFMVSMVPEKASLLQVVIYRNDGLTTAAAFASHVFYDTQDPQVALVDTSHGLGLSSLQLRKGSHSQTVFFGSVLTVEPGSYECVLLGDDPDAERYPKAVMTLPAVPRQSYVVLRVGIEAAEGPSLPEELVVFPTTLVHHFQVLSYPHSSAMRTGFLLKWLLLVAAVAMREM